MQRGQVGFDRIGTGGRKGPVALGLQNLHTARRRCPAEPKPAEQDGNTSRYISWSELLRRTFGIEIVCTKCKSQLRLIALIKNEDVAKKILTAMHLPSDVPQLRPARPPPQQAGGGDDWLN